MKYTYTIHGIQCEDCVIKIKEKIQQLPEVSGVDVIIADKEIIIDANQPLTVARVNEILKTIGEYRIAEKVTKQELEKKEYTIRDFYPLIVIFGIIIGLTLGRIWYYGWNPYRAMSDFMGFFFIIFGSFKLVNWKGFAEAYSTYDVIAKHSTLYTYAYPLIEIGLGSAYLLGKAPIATNFITLVIMLISSIGVAQELLKRKPIMCACLGVVFKIPMTWVTLIEDLLMAGMAATMLLIDFIRQ